MRAHMQRIPHVPASSDSSQRQGRKIPYTFALAKTYAVNREWRSTPVPPEPPRR